MNHKSTRRGFTQNLVVCPPCGESVAGATKEGQNWKKTLWPLLPRLMAVLPPQGREMFRGFTLIELLVAVLIIGVLAAVAVPQYQKAVYKSRATEALAMLKAIAQAQEVYYLANGQYTSDISGLDVEIPSSLIRISGENWPENSYKYQCYGSYCGACTANASMPCFDFNVTHKTTNTAGKFYCHLTSGNSKNDIAKSICQSMGTLDTSSTESWFAGKYFIINQ